MNDTVAVNEGTAGLSQLERVVDTFVAPTATFRDIRRSTSWWLPFVLASLASILITVAIQQKIGWEQVVETQVRMNPSQQSQISGLTPDQQATQIHRMSVGYQYVSFASPIMILIMSAIGALVLWASFNFGLGAQSTFGQMFCLWMYASLPRLLTGLVTLLRVWFGGSPESFDLKNAAGTNLGYYFSDAAPWVRALLGFFDVIGIWVLVLMIVGAAIVAKVKVAQSAAVIVGWWLLVMFVSVSATAAFS